jgi:hypothetical protein
MIAFDPIPLPRGRQLITLEDALQRTIAGQRAQDRRAERGQGG